MRTKKSKSLECVETNELRGVATSYYNYKENIDSFQVCQKNKRNEFHLNFGMRVLNNGIEKGKRKNRHLMCKNK